MWFNNFVYLSFKHNCDANKYDSYEDHDVKNANSRKVLVLEARDRIGGRIYTTKGYEPKNNVIEHGAQFIHGSIFVFTT